MYLERVTLQVHVVQTEIHLTKKGDLQVISPLVWGPNPAFGTTILFWHRPRTLSFSLLEEPEVIHVTDVFRPSLHKEAKENLTNDCRLKSARAGIVHRFHGVFPLLLEGLIKQQWHLEEV